MEIFWQERYFYVHLVISVQKLRSGVLKDASMTWMMHPDLGTKELKEYSYS